MLVSKHNEKAYNSAKRIVFLMRKGSCFIIISCLLLGQAQALSPASKRILSTYLQPLQQKYGQRHEGDFGSENGGIEGLQPVAWSMYWVAGGDGINRCACKQYNPPLQWPKAPTAPSANHATRDTCCSKQDSA